jgi:phosphoserine aminotransferase
MSVMEISHRSKTFDEYPSLALRTALRDLLSIPDNYRILFLQGGASSPVFR